MNKTELTQNKVVVLAGGWSDERDISMQSGEACQDALKQAGFETVDLVDVASPDFIKTLTEGGYDVAYVAMAGHYAEDVFIQGRREVLHMPYTFSGGLLSSLSTEKEKAKDVCKAAGVPVPAGVTLPSDAKVSNAEANELVERLGLPLFVKPTANGSSFGITRVTEASQLAGAVEKAGSEGDRVLVEECIQGTEITVPVIGNDDPQVLPIVEIAFDSEFYDLKVKYEPAALHHVMPARISEESYKKAEEYARRAYKALGCRGASRIDFIVKEDGTPVMLENNCIPGMTKSSLLPDSARHAGIEFPELCKKFVAWALEDAHQEA